MNRTHRIRTVCLALPAVLGMALVLKAGARHQAADVRSAPLVTGRRITPVGASTGVGSFPADLALSPDGRWIAVSDVGARQRLSILSAADGRLISQLAFDDPRKDDPKSRSALYYGLTFAPSPAPDGKQLLYASRGPEDRISVLNIDAAGKLTDVGLFLHDPSPLPPQSGDCRPNFPAGLALDAHGSHLYVANNETSAWTGEQGSVTILDVRTDRVLKRVVTPGFPYALAAVTRNPQADGKLYAACERDGGVAVIDVHDPAAARTSALVKTGDHPDALLLNHAQTRLFVANGGSDTVSILDVHSDRVIGRIALRPPEAHDLPGATPTGLALSPDERRLYVALADLNAVAAVDLQAAGGRVMGYLPVGWYPTALTFSPDGARLFVANAKGVQARNPNAVKAGPGGAWGYYIESVLEGAVSTLPTPRDTDLPALTAQVIADSGLASTHSAPEPLLPDAVKHVIYIIKENRTYDQVLGDLKQGDGDPKLCLFGRDVTPNQHAIAERFVLLDNFYCCGEVSGDGWPWSTSGMLSEYTARNVPFKYSGRGRIYDFEGQVNGSSPDLEGRPDVGRAPGGYLWDLCDRQGVSYRSYGIYLTSRDDDESRGPGGRWLVGESVPSKRALIRHGDLNFANPMRYADSNAWVHYNCPSPGQLRSFGRYHTPSRYAEWKREFDGFVRRGDLPALTIMTFQRDHTMGTREGQHSPRAMVADNDYAVGQLVEAVSHSPYWKSTAIFLVEDDAQSGIDHVDAHRSPCYVISPLIRRGTVDHHFYNTDSVLHTIERLLGLPPMCQYDAIAPVFSFFAAPGAASDNAAPFQSILPAREIASEINRKTAYRAADSARLDLSRADRAPDDVLNDILWHSVKGRSIPMPPSRRRLSLLALRRPAAH